MNCPYCQSSEVYDLSALTKLGYRQYRCSCCNKQYNERTGTLFNRLNYRSEIVVLVVHHYLRYKMSLDNIAEMMGTYGVSISHQTVHNWVHRFGPVLGTPFRQLRRHTNGKKWHVDHCTLKNKGLMYYFYRCFDKQGNLVDVMLSDSKDYKAAEQFLYQCVDSAGFEPDIITTDQEAAFLVAMTEVFGNRVEHRVSKYKNNRLDSWHHQPRSRVRPMKSFKNPLRAMVFLHSFEELDQIFRNRTDNRSARRAANSEYFVKYCNLLI